MIRPIRQKGLKQPPAYLSPIEKPGIKFSRNQRIDLEATNFIESIIDPVFDQFHNQFPDKEKCKLHLNMYHGLYLDLMTEPYETAFHYSLPCIKELNFFLSTLKRVSEIADTYYDIKVEKGKNCWSFEKTLTDGNSIVEKIAALKAADFNEIMQKAREEKKLAENDTQMKIEEVLSLSERTLQNLILDVNSGSII